MTLPATLQEIVDDFNAVSPADRLQLLLEFSEGLEPLPGRYADHPELLEPVPECQSPLFLATEIDGVDVARLFFQAPQESPTTRGFAGILQSGLDGQPVGDVLAVPDDAPLRFGLAEVVSPLRLRGMVAMLGRVKRQLRERAAA